MNHAPNFKNLKGLRFGKLYVIKYSYTKNYAAYWECLCDCGKTKVIIGKTLRNGDSTTCGCSKYKLPNGQKKKYNRVSTFKPNFKHGMCHSDEYKIWAGIKRRCFNPNEKAYKSYGAKGISMHPTWANDFYSFFSEVGIRPSKDHSIDRINNSGNYEPDNCRWATRKEQAQNKKINVWYNYGSKRMVISDWAKYFNRSRAAVYNYIKLYGFDKAYMFYISKLNDA